MAKLGFLGLGIMGLPMSLNLLKAGHEVRVWNRTPARCGPAVRAGAVACADPAEACRSADVTFAMVSDPEAALAVCGAAIGGLGDGRGYVDMSTVDPATSRAVAEQVAAAGGRFLEAPVSGSKQPAEQGTLVILCAGDEGLYTEAAPALEAMGKLHVHLGEVGKAAAMKLVVNMIMGTMMDVLGEGLALARSRNLAPAALLEILAAGAVANPMFAGKGPAIAAGDFPTAFPLKHMQKDMRLALALAAEAGLALPAAAAADGAFRAAMAAGLGDADFSAVCSIPG